MTKYQLAVFDWEGTLADTLGQILIILATEAKRLDMGAIDEYSARQSLQFGLVVAIKKLFPDAAREKQALLLEATQKALALRTTDAYLMPGAAELLARMKKAGMDLAIATNKGHSSLQRALKGSGLQSFFSITRSAGQAPAKPCPQMLEEIMACLGVMPRETIMIGDSASDMEMAQKAGVDAVGVDFYDQSDQNKELREAGALHVFNSYEQLADFLQV
ncbi:HAD-IA family hydrolase [Legionella londiniensis]|uniref:Hydrolase n=1 Tax=Legionella londiniensis TaxID=45068 RepID=A0A0W0VR82_9GAMM|nr:HAD-IA family hydrolase [Legionella londiniensis]KTD22641.1 hydrolase [Legionella londiniensis]STX92571.1 hydrolase (haloacid dehalogenase family) [Legionella londiniensis]